MAVNVIKDVDTNVSCMYDTVTDRAFGPVFNGWEVEDFLEWYEKEYLNGEDLRKLDVEEIELLKAEWEVQVEAEADGD